GNVYENPTSLQLHLEALRMRFQAYVGDLLAAHRVNNRKGPVSIADEDAMRRHVDPNIVGVLLQLDGSRGRQVLCVQQAHRAIARAGHINGVGRSLVRDALRLTKSGQGSQQLAFFEIHDANAVIAQFRDIQPLSRALPREVINATLHISQRDLGFEHQRFGCVNQGVAQDRHKRQSEKSWMSAKTPGAPSSTLTSLGSSSHQSLFVHTPPNEKSSNAVTLSAFVQTPTAPAPVIWSSSSSMHGLPSNSTLMCLAENSTRNRCHSLPVTGASTYLIVIRCPPSV